MGADEKFDAEVDKAKGKAKEVAGRMTHDKSLEGKGQLDQAKGNAKEAWEKAKDAVTHQGS